MVGERRGREDRRKRRIRPALVMGETQQGAWLLSLKDDGRRERERERERDRDGQMEMRMRFQGQTSEVSY